MGVCVTKPDVGVYVFIGGCQGYVGNECNPYGKGQNMV